MAQWLRALAVLPKFLGLISNIHIAAHNYLLEFQRIQMPFSGLLWDYTQAWCTDICSLETPIHKNKVKTELANVNQLLLKTEEVRGGSQNKEVPDPDCVC